MHTISSPGESACHRPVLAAHAMQIGARNILELGALHGDTTLPLLLGAYYSDGHVHTVDMTPSKFNPPAMLKARWHMHQGEAHMFLRNLPAHVIFDLVWLDDEHSYEHVVTELQALAPHLHRDSIVLLHDTAVGVEHEEVDLVQSDGGSPHHQRVAVHVNFFELPYVSMSRSDCGVLRAVRELPVESWEHVTVTACYGATMLRKKDAPRREQKLLVVDADGYMV